MSAPAINAANFFQRIRYGFSPVFWIANTLELFERLAFYGSKAVLNFYLAKRLGLGLSDAGWLVGLYSGLIYALPIVAGVLVDRFGFRKTLIACFAIFTAGYFLLGLAGMPAGDAIMASIGKTGYLAAVLTFTAVGGSLIKPCVVGSVERTSNPDYRALGFSIYYALVNLGGAIGPLLFSEVRARAGIEYVFIASSLTSACLVIGAALFFREPDAGAPSGNRTFGQVFRDMLLVFRNLRFITFLVIFSGFWIMFWQIFYSFPFYVDEVLQYKRFEVLETVDAWTIILLSIPLTALAKRLSPIRAMTLGFLISSSSWFIIAFTPTIGGAIAGLFLFAVGESTQAPRYYDYVGTLAPKEQVGTFMGFAFLPVAIGSVVAGRLGAWFVQHYIRDTMQPQMIWINVAIIGLVTTAMMVGYDRLFNRGSQ